MGFSHTEYIARALGGALMVVWFDSIVLRGMGVSVRVGLQPPRDGPSEANTCTRQSSTHGINARFYMCLIDRSRPTRCRAADLLYKYSLVR